MSDQELLKRISIDPKIVAGKPTIAGTRLTVEYVLNLFAHGATLDELLKEYEGITREDVSACFLFAKKALEDTAFLPLETGAA
jgi:uncharacterized protein (DUF433 family)